MGLPYDPVEVESRWRARWEADGLYRADVTAGPDFYNLAEFPYPSAAGLHVGHVFNVQRHHLYARFVTMALHDLGLVPFEEPFPRIRLGGVIVQDGAKMSKSRGNVVSPDELLAEPSPP